MHCIAGEAIAVDSLVQQDVLVKTVIVPYLARKSSTSRDPLAKVEENSFTMTRRGFVLYLPDFRVLEVVFETLQYSILGIIYPQFIPTSEVNVFSTERRRTYHSAFSNGTLDAWVHIFSLSVPGVSSSTVERGESATRVCSHVSIASRLQHMRCGMREEEASRRQGLERRDPEMPWITYSAWSL